VYDYNTENILHLMKVEKSVVVIDNLDHMMEFFNLKKKTNPLEVLEEIYDNNNWIVVLCNMQTSKEYMVKFAQYYPECKFWNDRFMSNEEDKMVLKKRF
jgi:archaellum biogenesis ATPase FlaH